MAKVLAKVPITQHAITTWVLRWGSNCILSEIKEIFHYSQGNDATDETSKDVKRVMASLVQLRYVSGILEADDILINMRPTH